MKYITIDGDDVGHTITSCYLRNDLNALIQINDLVNSKTAKIAEYLKSKGFTVIFRAADGVAAYSTEPTEGDNAIFEAITRIANRELTFSAGTGGSLRESYIALLCAKSGGKARIETFQDLASDA